MNTTSTASDRVTRALLSATVLLTAALSPAPAAEPGRLLNLSLAELGEIKIDTVFAASKFTEKVTDAPSSVTIVTRDEIQRFGYRTLGEIVRSVRSFDATYDRNYSHAGVRGFTSLNDIGSRILLLIDGHRMNDPILHAAAVGTEGLLDVDLIERVEFIRGPGSAIYGSNAFFGVINVITRSGAAVDGVEASAGGGSFESYSGRLTLGKKLANGVEYLFSGTTYASAGPGRLYFKEFAEEANRGIAERRDGDRYWSVLGKVSYGDFTLQGGYVARDKDVPTGSQDTLFNVPHDTVDRRGYVELRYAHETASGWALNARAHYDIYDFARYRLLAEDARPALLPPPEPVAPLVEDPEDVLTAADAVPVEEPKARDLTGVVNDDSGRARWWGVEAGVSRTFFNCFRFALGTEVRRATELRQRNYDGNPAEGFLDVSSEQLVLGAYADARWEIVKSLSLSGGVRWDHYDSFGHTVNPRAALIWKPLAATTVKLLYGQAFRAPGIYQLNYSALEQLANPALGPETIRTYEIVAEQYVGTHWRGGLSLFRNEIWDLIDTADAGEFILFDNVKDARVHGAEIEIEGKWSNGLLLRASYTRQEAVNTRTGLDNVNAPENIFKGHLSVPLFRDKIFGSIEALCTSDRTTLGRARSGDVWLLNTTLFSRELAPGLEMSASIYNLLDQKYRTPVGEGHSQDVIAQDGRTFWLKLSHRF